VGAGWSLKGSRRPGSSDPSGRGGRWLLLGAVLATALVVGAFVVALVLGRLAASSQAAAKQHSNVLRTSAKLLVEVEGADSGQRGYLLTGNPSYLQTYTLVQADIPRQVDTLDALTGKTEQPQVDRLRILVAQKEAALARSIEVRRTQGMAAAVALADGDRGQVLTDQITAIVLPLVQDSQQQDMSSDRAAGRAGTAVLVAASVGVALAVGLLVLLIWLIAQRWRLATARRDAEHARDQLLKSLSQQATHDALTGLPNRRLVADRLEQALLRREPGRLVAVMYIDLDGFKAVNDQYGHARGDEVLLRAARRMRAALRPADTLARVGGDEFVAVCEGLTATEEGHAIADRLRRSAAHTLNDELALSIGASVGLVFTAPYEPSTPDGAQGRPVRLAISQLDLDAAVEDLLTSADDAMYEAKRQGRGRLAVYDVAMAAARHGRREDAAALRQAFDAGHLWVAYQPMVDLGTGEVLGVEALLRWTDPERGPIPPARFIATAEDSGLIQPIGEFVLRTACEQVAEWNTLREATGRPPLTVSVNVSSRQVSRPDFCGTVARTLAYGRLTPDLLCVEITEQVLIDAVGAGTAELEQLSGLGVRIALDDYGTGYSSLSHLHRFPIDVVKIDRSLVAGLGHSERDEALVSAIIGLARTLHRQPVAEGVETAAQASLLRAWGCQQGQGFLYAEALAALDLEAFLLRRGAGAAPLPSPRSTPAPDRSGRDPAEAEPA
jgi:diguanylate cyclase (GGDEF)-like protein